MAAREIIFYGFSAIRLAWYWRAISQRRSTQYAVRVVRLDAVAPGELLDT